MFIAVARAGGGSPLAFFIDLCKAGAVFFALGIFGFVLAALVFLFDRNRQPIYRPARCRRECSVTIGVRQMV